MEQIKNKIIESYWLKKLSGELPKISLPLVNDGKEEKIHTRTTQPLHLEIPGIVASKLFKSANGSDIALFILFFSGLNVVLKNYTGLDDLIVGTVPPAKNSINNNIIFGRNTICDDLSIKELINHAKEVVLEAINYSEYHLDEILEALKIKNNITTLDIFSIAFIYEPFQVRCSSLDRFDLVFILSTFNRQMSLKVEYSLYYNSHQMVMKFCQNLIVAIERMLDDPGQKISQLDILSTEEKKLLLYDFNSTKADYPGDKTLHDLFQEQAGKTPDNIVIVGPSIGVEHRNINASPLHLTYRELNEQSDRLAQWLKEKKVGPDTIAGLMVERSIEMIIGIMGILKAGGAYLPIDPEYPRERIDFMLKDSNAEVLVTTPKLKIKVKTEDEERFIEIIDISNLSSFSTLTSTCQVSPASLAYIIYTSGTTGQPKGTLIEHRNAVRLMSNEKFQFNFDSSDVWTLFHSYCFDFSVWEMYGALLYGGKLLVIPKRITRDPEKYLDILKKAQVTVLNQTPSAFYNLSNLELSSPGRELSIRYVIFGGEALTPSRLKEWKSKYPVTKLINMYGITETTVHVTFKEIEGIDIESNISNIGKPIPTLSTYVMDKNLKLLPIGAAGELVVGGKGVGRGYLNRPELSRIKFVENPYKPGERLYKSGDLVKLLPTGDLRYIGRIDHQVKIRGFRIELDEIESQLLKYGEIKDAVVLVSESGGEKYLCAYIVSDKKFTSKELRTHLSAKLPDYMIPSHFLELEKIPLTQNGKVDRDVLDLYGKRLNTGAVYVAPQNDIQEKIIDIWKQVLKLEKVGIHDNYFDLGGTSFDILKINESLKKTFQVEIPIPVMFRFTTVDSIEKFLNNKIGEVSDRTEQLRRGKDSKFEKEEKRRMGIAVIGMAGKFPGAKDLDEFWDNIKHGKETISFFTDNELRESDISEELLNDPDYVKAAGILEGIEYFDASFFGYTPKEAEIMDPQFRFFHECVWNALEDAGYDPGEYEGLIGLYAGASPNGQWQARVIMSGKYKDIGSFAAGQLMHKGFLTLRISYKLNLKGPGFELNTACSTSLVAIHTGCMAILNGECDLALAGGVTISHLEKSGYLYKEGMILSPDGHCRTFDAGTEGTIASDGAGAVVLKRLEDAILDRDHIYAVIKGTSINNDGISKAGFTAPGVEGQASVIQMALQMAEVAPESINYIETHGTGTELGDPVEIEALKLAFNTEKKSFCAIGSVKSNIGHTDAAAGVAGFIKTILALKYKCIPPSLNFETPNPNIDFINTPFYINSALSEWEKGEYPRRAGVSSFGIGGTNAHVVLEQAPAIGHSSLVIGEKRKEREYQLILLSAKTSTALNGMKENLAKYLKENPYVNFADAAYTLQVGRKGFNQRWMGICSTRGEAIEVLTSPDAGETHMVAPEEEKHESMKIEPDVSKDRLTEIGRLWLHGQKIDCRAFYPGEKPYRISLPTYPFERQRYWITSESIDSMLQREKPIDPVPGISEWFYLPAWKRSILEPLINKNASIQQRWLVFANDSNLGNFLVNRLKETYRDVFVVKIGSSFNQVNDHLYTVNPREYNHYENLMDKLRILDLLPDKIIHLWNITEEYENIEEYYPGINSIEKTQYPGFFSLLYIAQILGKQDFGHDIHIHVLTNHVQEVIGNELLSSEKSTILGLLKVIPQEYAGIRCSSIDIELPQPGTLEEKELIRLLLEEFLIGSTDIEPEIAYRNNRRWLRIFDPLHLEAPPPGQLKLRKKGVFLITGGLGKIGLMFAELFVKRAGARLILTGRSPIPSQEESFKIKKLKELEEMGGEVIYMQADAADLDQMRNVIHEAEKRFGSIDGIIHAAGVTEGQSMRIIRDLTLEDCQIQFQSKIWGVLVLNELFKDKPLDFCWMLSSISCVLGGLGFGAYASANRFMDAFVKKHNRSNPGYSRWFSLNWDGMDTSGSIDIFERMFTLTKTDQMVVSREGNLHDRIHRWIKLGSLEGKNRAKEENTSSFHPRPNLPGNYIAPRNPTEITLAKIWQNLLGYEEIGVKDDFLELGGDSLRAITVISRIHQELGVNIPVTEFFSKPTVEGITEYISVRAHIEKNTFISIEPAEEKQFYPLSSAQKRLYILQQMEVDNISYNLPYIMRLEGKIETYRLEETFKKLVERHESLRTSFEMTHNEPIQRIHKKVEFEIECYDLQVAGASDRCRWEEVPFGQVSDAFGEDLATEDTENTEGTGGLTSSPGTHRSSFIIHHSFVRPFDLSKAPMLRVGLIKENEQKHILMVDIHHIISDGISLEIFIRDFKLLYTGGHLSLLKLQYKDFSGWQNSQLNNREINEQEEYWLRELGGETPVLNLPTDFPRPTVQSYEGKTIAFELSKDETGLLKEMARLEEVTLFMIILSIFKIFLYKICGQEDIIIGTPILGRRHADLYGIIGFFVNTLALRNYIPGQETFQTFLNRLKKRALDAFDNQDYQFENLVDKIETKRDMSRNPIFSVSFVLNENIWQDTNELPGKELKGIKVTPYPYKYKTSKFDLSLQGVENEEKLYFSFEYCTKLFKEETIVRYINYFKRIVREVIDALGKKISEIEISSGEDKKQILYDFNDTASDYPKDKTIHRLFEEQVERSPDNAVVVGGWQRAEGRSEERVQITYRKLDEQSNRLALQIQERGSYLDSIVGIMLEQSVEMIIGVLGILKSGAAYLPIDPNYPQDRIDFMLKDSGAKILIDRKLPPISPCESFRYSSFIDHHPGNLAYVIYTSGSTGRPRGVMIKYRSLVNLCCWHNTFYSVTSWDRATKYAGSGFDASVWEIFPYLVTGASIYIVPEEIKLDIEMLNRYYEVNDITISFLPTQVCEQFMAVNNTSLRILLTGGDKLRSFIKRNYRLYNNYGPTENTVVTTSFCVTEALGNIPIGKPIFNTRIYILNHYRHLQPIGVPGELYIGGESLALGYLNNPELTTEKFDRDLWDNQDYHDKKFCGGPGGGFSKEPPGRRRQKIYNTGDLGRWLPDGNIEFLGRIDHQVKIRGFRIELGEIESRLLNIGGIKEAVVLAWEDDSGDRYICAYIVSAREYGISELREYLSKELPDYMMPSYFVRIEKIPLTPNGKIDRRALPKPELKVGEDYTAPRNEIEAKLVDVWSNVLNLERDVIGIDSNFFELGGHSLNATVVISKIHKVFDVNVPLAEIFKMPKIRALAEYIKGKGKEFYISIEPAEEKEYYLLSSAQKRLYILQQMNLDSTAYNMPEIIPLPAASDWEKIEDTFKKLIKCHESLRTSFQIVNDTPVQVVHDEVEFEIEYEEVEVKVEVEEEVEPYGQVLNACGDDLATEDTEDTEEKNYNAPVQKKGRSRMTNYKKIPNHKIQITNKKETKVHHSSFIIHNSFIVRPFDLAKAPLIRTVLVKGEDKHILIVDMHHIISDGISHEILVRDCQALYEEELPPLRIQYKDFSQWQNGEKEEKNLKRQEEYWLQEFEGEIPVLELPTDYPRPVEQSFEGNSVNFEIKEEETRALKAMALSQGATLFMVLMAIYNILLFKLSGQEDIVIGTPIAGRKHADLKKIIGMFVNTLSLKNYPAGEKTFAAFLEEIKEKTLAAFENQDYQFEDIVEKVVLKRDMSRNPIFDVMLVFQNFINAFETDRMLGKEKVEFKIKPHTFEHRTVKFDLTLTAIEKRGKLYLILSYCSKLFKKETIEKLTGYFKQIVTTIIANPYKRIADIEIISRETRNKMLSYFNENLKEAFGIKSIQSKLFDIFQKYKKNIAVEYGTAQLTYAELENRAACISKLIADNNIKKGSSIGIYMEDKIDIISAIIGILNRACIFVPLCTTLPVKRIENMIQLADIRVILTDTGHETILFAVTGNYHVSTQICVINDSFYRSFRLNENENQDTPYDLKDKVYIYFTSGSTGIPNAIVGKNESLVQFLTWQIEKFSINETYRISQLTAVGFDAFLRDVFVPLFVGGTVCIPRTTDMERLVDWIDSNRINLVHCVPSVFRLINSEELTGVKYTHLKYIVLSGESINPNELKRWYGIFGDRIQLVNYYGTTETTMSKTFHFIQVSEMDAARIPAGFPMRGTRIIILDKYLKICGRGIIGEIYIRTLYHTHGYLNNPELNAERFIKNPFSEDGGDILHKTGDMGKELENGEIEVLGRIDRQVKIRGVRIELGNIENCLLKHGKIEKSLVINRKEKDDENVLCAYIVYKKQVSQDTESMPVALELREHLSKELPEYMIPSYFIPIEEVPLTPNRKVDWKSLPEPGFTQVKSYTTPRNGIEKKLVEIWSEVLGRNASHTSQLRESIGIDNDFFELGGHSLRVTVMAAKIHKELNVRVPLLEVFKTPTIRGLSESIKGLTKNKYESIDLVEEREYYELSSTQKRLYAFHQMDEKSTRFNMFGVVRLEGPIIKDKVEDVFKKLIKRHESFRTSFKMMGSEPVQAIHGTVGFKVEYYELCSEHKEGDAKQIVKKIFRYFDLSQAPLLRVEMIKMAEEKYILAIDMHHIISDGVSVGMTRDEFLVLYAGEELPVLRLQYKDFSEWQKRLLDLGEIKNQKEYWLSRFKGNLPVLNMPLDYPWPSIYRAYGSRISFKVDREITTSLKQLVLETETTLYIMLLAIFNILLSKYSRQGDIIVGSPVAGRRHADMENIIGLFVNMLAMRNQPENEKTFIEFLNEVKMNALDAFENQDYQFESLVWDLGLKAEYNRNPLFIAVFVFQNMAAPGIEVHKKDELNKVRVLPYEIERERVHHELQLNGVEDDDILFMDIQYASELFSEATARKMVKNYREILEQVIANPGTRLQDVRLSHGLTAAKPNNTQADPGDFVF